MCIVCDTRALRSEREILSECAVRFRFFAGGGRGRGAFLKTLKYAAVTLGVRRRRRRRAENRAYTRRDKIIVRYYYEYNNNNTMPAVVYIIINAHQTIIIWARVGCTTRRNRGDSVSRSSPDPANDSPPLIIFMGIEHPIHIHYYYYYYYTLLQ